MLRYSEEQEAILSSPAGFNMVVANAGVGKTEISAEFIVRAYLEEEQRLKPGGRLEGQEQLDLIKQFKVISFTVKAAGELTSRVYKKFAALGIPVPNRDGREVPLARTCDAYLQRWLSHPLVMTLWLKQWGRWADRLTEVLNMSPQVVQKKLMSHYDRGEWRGERALQTHWGCLLNEPVRNALVTVACMRHALVPGWQKLEADLRATVSESIKRLEDNGSRQWSSGLDAKIVGLVAKFSSTWEEGLGRLDGLPLEEQVREEARLKPWMNLKALRSEFLQLYDVSRSIGYHPYYCPEAMASKMLLERLCAMEKLSSFALFQAVAGDYENFKLLVLKMDFGDYMQAVKTTFERNPYLLEKDKEYPRLGFRAKYLIWDEAQDNSMWQYWILNLLCGSAKSKFHCLVLGDPKQAIYGFRGGNAEEFVRNIRFLKSHASQHLFGLTTSYRSCQQIIALGNEVARLLPAGRVEALDSRGVYHEAGSIHLAPPMRDAAEELAYIKKEYTRVRQQFGPESSVMLLVRSNLEEHPAYTWSQQQKDKNLVMLTHHRSKGLEADHVLLLGLTAGRFPEPRSSMRDEVNLFYVAVTRARIALHLCCPQILLSDGEEKSTGISPFVPLVATLKQLAVAAGWTEEALKLGERAHKALVAAFLSKQKARKASLLKELCERFPEVPTSHYTRQNSMDTGARWKRQFREPDKRHIATKPFGH